MTRPDDQPQLLPWMSASVRQNRPAAESTHGGHVQAGAGLGAATLRHQPQRHAEGDGADRHVDEEDPVPVRVLHQYAAERGSERGGDGAERAPEADGKAVLALREHAQEDRQAHRRHGGSADGLSHAEADEHLDAGREAARQGEEGEQDQPADEHALLAEAVGQPTGRQEQGGHPQVVGVEDPRYPRHPGVQVLHDRRNGDIDDGGVEQGHEHAQRDRRQDPPLAAV